jgi:predicted nucleotidyltransferase
MQKEEIIKTLRAELPLLKREYGVQSIGLFGSHATGKNHADSDLDFLVELSAPLAKNYFDLWAFLENRFRKKVDLVRKGTHLREKFLRHIQSEIVYA